MNERREINKINMEYQIAKICLQQMKMNPNKKKKLEDLLYQLSQTDLENTNKNSKIFAKMRKIIEKEEKDRIDIESKQDIVAEELSKRLREKNDYSFQTKVSSAVKIGTWGENFLKAASDYQRERRLKKAQEDAEKRQAEEKQKRERERQAERAERERRNQEERQRQYTERTEPRRERTSSIYTEPVKTTRRELSSNELEQQLIQLMQQELQKKHYGYFSLDRDLEDSIRATLGYTKGDRVIRTIEKGASVLDIKRSMEEYEAAKKNPFKQSSYTPRFDEVLKAATYVVEVLPGELLRNNNDEKSRLAGKLTSTVAPEQILRNYEKIYRIYSDYYNSLSPSQQEKIKESFDAEHYPELHLENFKLPSPDYLTVLVNQRVSKKMIDNKEYYGKTSSTGTTLEILKATRYMTPEEIARIYNQMKNDEYSYRYSGESEYLRRQQEEMRANLQHNFARAILAKETNGKLTPQQEKEFLEQICKEHFHEKADSYLVDLSVIEKRTQVYLKEKQETDMIFGMAKMKKTLSKAKESYGRYAKNEELKAMLNTREEELEETRQMSR